MGIIQPPPSQKSMQLYGFILLHPLLYYTPFCGSNIWNSFHYGQVNAFLPYPLYPLAVFPMVILIGGLHQFDEWRLLL